MRNRKPVVAICAMLLIFAVIGAACTAKPGGEPALNEAPVLESVTLTPTTEPSPVTTDDSLPTDEYDDMEDSNASLEEGYSIPIVSDISETDNTPLSSAAPVPTTTATTTATPKPKPTSTPTPLPTVRLKPTATPLPTSTPTIPPVPTSTPAPTPVSTLTPMPTATPSPILTPVPAPVPEAPMARTICNICGADITGNVPPHGDGHLLNGEDFSYRVE